MQPTLTLLTYLCAVPLLYQWGLEVVAVVRQLPAAGRCRASAHAARWCCRTACSLGMQGS